MKNVTRDIGLSKREKITGWILGAVFLIVFLASPNLNNPNGDTLGWINYLDEFVADDPAPDLSSDEQEVVDDSVLSDEDPGWRSMFNPHHLLYLPVTAVFYEFSHMAYPDLASGSFLRIWNSLFSAATLIALFFLLSRLFPRSPWVLPWIIFTGTSVTYFRYATDGTQYMTALFFLTLASSAIVDFIRTKKSGCLAQSGMCLAVAVLFHQIVALIVPFLIFGCFRAMKNLREDGHKLNPKFIWAMAAYSIGVPTAVYLLVAYFTLGPTDELTLPGIFRYATLYAHNPEYWHANFLDGLVLNLKTTLGFYFGNDRAFFLLFDSWWFTALALILPIIWLIGLKACIKPPPELKSWLDISLLWLGPLFIFLCFWNPGHEFYHLFLIIPLITLAVYGTHVTLAKSATAKVALVFFWIWIIISIIFNLPYALEGSTWFQSAWLY